MHRGGARVKHQTQGRRAKFSCEEIAKETQTVDPKGTEPLMEECCLDTQGVAHFGFALSC